jgi:tetratricopeptide (TPR) repeat protein
LLEALRLGDSDGTTYGLLGFCRLQRGEYATALQAYRMASLSQPQSAEWKAGIAQCLQNLDAREEAVALIDEVIRLRPRESSYAELQAALWIDLDRPEKALQALELPRRLGVLSADGLIRQAELHLRVGQIALAKARVDGAFAGELQPGVDRLAPLIAAAFRQAEWALVERVLERAEAAGAGDDSVVLESYRGQWLIESGTDPAAGAARLEQLLAEHPGHGPALLSLAGYHVANDELARAEVVYQRATVDRRTALDAWIELARLRVAGERHDDALAAVDEALAIRDDPALQRYRDALEALADAAR